MRHGQARPDQGMESGNKPRKSTFKVELTSFFLYYIKCDVKSVPMAIHETEYVPTSQPHPEPRLVH